MKERIIGIGKALFYIVLLLFVCWVLKGFNELTEAQMAVTLSIGAIMIHFVEREVNKQ